MLEYFPVTLHMPDYVILFPVTLHMPDYVILFPVTLHMPDYVSLLSSDISICPIMLVLVLIFENFALLNVSKKMRKSYLQRNHKWKLTVLLNKNIDIYLILASYKHGNAQVTFVRNPWIKTVERNKNNTWSDPKLLRVPLPTLYGGTL